MYSELVIASAVSYYLHKALKSLIMRNLLQFFIDVIRTCAEVVSGLKRIICCIIEWQ